MDSGTVQAFYDRFPYPPAPDAYARLLDDPWLFAKAIGQETGRKDFRPKKIWVAGCGAMQALNTALAFPESEVLGTDISEEQLARCRADERQVGAPNLELRRFDLASDLWTRQFDYVICTGVIHHMPDPRVGLLQLRSALATDGLLELMVYHSYHVEKFAAFADAVRTLLGTRDAPDFEREWEAARGLVSAGVPDTLIHPIIHHYTMRSLARLVQLGALRFVQPRHNHESKGATWSIVKPGTMSEWERLSDLDRWTVSSELQFSRSPMLWFYLEHENSSSRKTTSQLDEEFTSAEKRPFRARMKPYVRRGGTLIEGEPIAFPPPPPAECTSRLQLTTQANAYLEIV